MVEQGNVDPTDDVSRDPSSNRRGRSFRSACDSLRSAYENGDAKSLLAAYDYAARDVSSFRVAAALIKRLYPAREFLRLAARLDRDIATKGFHQTCRDTLQVLLGEWNAGIPEAVEPFLRTGAAIFYGNHPSLLTPFLIGAHVERPDLRYVSTTYVCRLIPEFDVRSFPVEVPLARVMKEFRRGGLKRVLAFALVGRLHHVPCRDAIQQQNRRSLQRAIDHVRSGGSLVICPDGGGRRSSDWYPGIGLIVRALVESCGDVPVHVVPFREEQSSNYRVYAQLMRGPVARLKRAWFSRKPVRIRFGQPLEIHKLAATSWDVEHTVSCLRRYYDRQLASITADGS